MRTTNTIQALEQARAQLELALEADADWRALREAATPASRAAFRLGLANNPVYRAWDLLGRVIEEMRTERVVRRDGAAPGVGRPKTGEERPRVELRHVLERIRSDAGLEGGKLLTASLDRAAVPAPANPDEQPQNPSAAGPAIPPPDIEEATVSFVIREPGPLAPPQATPGAPPGAEPPAAIPTTEAEDDVGDEAEVVIVSRHRD
jgi:hypothetical protein